MSIMFYDGTAYWPSGDPGSVFVVGYSQQYVDAGGDDFYIKYSLDQMNKCRAAGGFIPYQAVTKSGFPWQRLPNAWHQRPQ
jgi:hypothetical protein